MKISVALLVIFAAVLTTGHAWRRFRVRLPRLGLRRVISKVCTPLCSTKCTASTTPFAAPVCHKVCDKVCNIGRKRRAVPKLETGEYLRYFPKSVADYDSNGDGYVQFDEMIDTMNLDKSDAELRDLFNLADDNGDGKLSQKELENGPFMFEDGSVGVADIADDEDDADDE